MEGNKLLYALALLILLKEPREHPEQAVSFTISVKKRERYRQLCEAWAWMGRKYYEMHTVRGKPNQNCIH
jgi:hypothetical protein